jgi:caffeoyl-CoA O-methyltransferase
MDLQAAEDYAFDHTTKDSELVEELIAVSEEELEFTDMLSGRFVGCLLSILIKISGARRVLEIGTFTGYSALTIAEALPENGELFTCEYNERYERIARKFFNKSNAGSKIRLIIGRALETIPDIEGNFDFVFLDADKINYPDYYRMVLPRLQQGGVLVVDNVLWGGDAITGEGEKGAAIDRLNSMISKDESVEQVMLTVRDGITIVRKK